MRSRCVLYLCVLLVAGFVAWSGASARGEEPVDEQRRPKVTVRVVEGGESTAKPEDCRGVIVGPGVNQPDPFPGYAGFVGWESPIRLRDGTWLVGFNAGYWHASPPTPLRVPADVLKSWREMGMPADVDAPTGGRAMLTRSMDGGRTWSKPETLIDTPADDRHPSFLELPDGAILCSLFTYVGQGDMKADPSLAHHTRIVRSTDRGHTWQLTPPLPSPFVADESDGPMVLLDDGSVLLTLDGQPPDGAPNQSALLRSQDAGQTWELLSVVATDHDLYETNAVQLPDGRLVLMARPEGDIAWSEDGGRTWTQPVTFGMRLFAPSLHVLRDGTLLCLHGSYGAGGLRAIFSTDGGHTWVAPAADHGFLIDRSYGYGKAMELPDGSLFISYISTGGHRAGDARANAVWCIRMRVRPDHSGIDVLPAPSRSAALRQLGDLTGPWRLFVDDEIIADKGNVVRTYHAFEKHADNPILVADKPWEGTAAYVYGTVLPAEDGDGYRMWYHSWAGEYRMLYATSTDGLRWAKPELGLVEYAGSKANNILFRRTHENHNPQVIHTPWDGDGDCPQRVPETGLSPSCPYKMVYFEYGRTPPDYTVTGYYGACSPDGVHWTDVAKAPVLPDHPGDVGNFVWDPLGKRYLGFPKKFAEVRGFRRRCVGYSETTDFNSWPATQMVLTPDEFDDRWIAGDGQHTDFYGLCGFAYESMYLGFLWVFRITDGKNDGPIFVELVSSHDGVHWTRQEEPRAPILPLGLDGAWDDGMLFTTNHPLVEGDTIRLYYGGFDTTHATNGNGAIGLATLRKDGFASLDAGEDEGVVTTKAVPGCIGRLAVNYSAPNGALAVEVLDQAGGVVPGYGREDCALLSGDSVDQRVTWKGAGELPRGGGPLRLRFILRKGSLYSFAAGGLPGSAFTGPIRSEGIR